MILYIKTMKNDSRINFVLLLTYLCIALMFFGVIFFSTALYSRKVGNNQIFEKSSYQYLRKNHKANETYFGSVTFPHKIETSDFVSYDFTNEGDHVLISNFGDEEYECHGTCSCEEDSSFRRSSGVAISKGISYLLVATSAIFAYEKAREHFNLKCAESFSQYCNVEFIKSAIDGCSPSMKKKSREFLEDGKSGERRMYFCYGNCVSNLGIKLEETMKEASKIECDKLKQEGEIILFESELISHSKIKTSTKFSYTARRKFQEYYLRDFCKENSRFEYIYSYESFLKKSDGDGDDDDDYIISPAISMFQLKKAFACVAKNSYIIRDDSNAKKKSDLTNIHCRQVDPPPTSSNSEYHDNKWWNEKRKWDLKV